MDIELKPVESSQIAAIGYDDGSQTLAVQFHPRKSTPDEPGAVYHYSGVDAEAHGALVNAESIGKHFGAHIKGTYDFKRIEPQQADQQEA